jgi:hypothetical protein
MNNSASALPFSAVLARQELLWLVAVIGGVNGAVSVVASVLVALSAGFTVVLVVGAACYGLAMAVISTAF